MKSKSQEQLVEIELSFDEPRMRLLERAAAYAGESVDQFVLTTALAQARKTIRARKTAEVRIRHTQGGR